jgi:hypothetical protein
MSSTNEPELDLSMLRDRAIQFATSVSHTSIEDLLVDADKIQLYLLTGQVPTNESSSSNKSL